jgi:DNA-binding NarL/FixJ family response regulator
MSIPAARSAARRYDRRRVTARQEPKQQGVNTNESRKGPEDHGDAAAAERSDTPAPRIRATRASSPIRIVLVEDHAILREGLRALLELESDLEVVGEADEVNGALEAIERLQPHLCITDLALPGRSGIALISELCRLKSSVRMLVLTAHNTEEYIRAALNAGAHGYVLKDSGRADLLQAIHVVVSGGQYLCPSVSARVVSGFINGGESRSATSPEQLVTLREKQVLTRIALGHSNKLIARDLGLSVKTVEKHRSNLMRKLTLHNAAGITLFALRHGFIEAGGQAILREKAAI